jgi:hypothetical protein
VAVHVGRGSVAVGWVANVVVGLGDAVSVAVVLAVWAVAVGVGEVPLAASGC